MSVGPQQPLLLWQHWSWAPTQQLILQHGPVQHWWPWQQWDPGGHTPVPQHSSGLAQPPLQQYSPSGQHSESPLPHVTRCCPWGQHSPFGAQYASFPE
jgi:hypothetical protein